VINNKQKKAEKLLEKHLNRNSYRILEDTEGLNKKTVCSLTNKTASELIHSNELTKILKPQKFSGIMQADGKYLPVKIVEGRRKTGLVPISVKRRGKTKKGLVVIPFMDYFTHDIPVYIIALSENMYDIEKGFRELKELGYPLKVLVCDESMGEIAQVAKKVYPDVIIQYCLTHYSWNIERTFKVNGIKKKIKSLNKKLEAIGENICIKTRYYSIEKARKLVNEIDSLEFEYLPLIQIQGIFQKIFWKIETKQELENAENELNELIARIGLKTYKHANKIKKRYHDYYQKREKILAWLFYSELDIPKTTNLIEGFNSTTIELRLSSIRGFETEKTAYDYINALILKRRFQKFKDCKGKFKHLNGKSPLEISKTSVNFDSKNWINFCRNLKK
jgi:hypothetical protein